MDAEIKLGILRKNSLKVKVYENVKKKKCCCVLHHFYISFPSCFRNEGINRERQG